MGNTPLLAALARALLMLRSWSVRELARQAGVSHSGLAEWLKNQPGRLSADRVAEALAALGAPGGVLAPGVVHRWEIRDTDGLAALSPALASVGQGWVLVPLALEPGITMLPVPWYALRRGEVRVLLRHRPRLGVTADEVFPTPERLQGWVAYPPGVDQANPRRLDEVLGRGWSEGGWLDGGEVSVAMYDGLFGSVEPAATWADVQRTAALMGLGPADILRHLRQIDH